MSNKEENRKQNCGSEQQRVGCALGGIYTALAINNVLPVLHSGPGCQLQSGTVLAKLNGGQNAYPYQETIIPCTDFSEADVIFGGSERFRKVIASSMKYYKTDLIVAVDGCTAEIVGDDIKEVAESFEGSDVPVIYATLPGFKGNNLYGHSQVLKAIIDQFLDGPVEKVEKQVNVWGIVPFYDATWQGTLVGIEKLLKDLGFKPNIIYGRNKGIEEVKKIPQAEWNLLLSPWLDLDIVKKLEKKYQTPFLHFDHVPSGPTETTKLIRAIAEFADLDKEFVEDYIRDGEEEYYYYISRQLASINEGINLPKTFSLIGSAAAAVSTVRFMVNDLGFVPKKVYIVENVPEKHEEAVRNALYDLELEDKDFELVFTDDGGLPAAELLQEETPGEVILGSTWDEVLARDLNATFFPISVPIGPGLIGRKSYFGYTGGVDFFVDFYTRLLEGGRTSI
ncbi:MAG: nitrogenase molybdenum-iron protein, alpha and beta chain [Lachnospiraceae bacterium]|nr:nitrogenase molybdenum-iron protein, alpha and beta chain [Lachnospiraceae bacterium]